ncbi:MAG: GntR family transcriptional regulator [Dongiaceae bacterium]
MTSPALQKEAGNGRHRPLPTPSRERFERLYATIRDRICLLEYRPLEHLSEEELAAEFNVSRTPIRRVLSRLEAEGLVESRHGVGTIVTSIGFETLGQVYQLRLELAILIGRLTPIPRSAEDLARVRALLARFDGLEREPDPKALSRLNMDFYQELRAMTGNIPLRDISDRLYFMTHRIWMASLPHLYLQDEIVIFRREVADILAAMEIGDLDAVGYIRRSHISMAFRRLERYAAAAAGLE